LGRALSDGQPATGSRARWCEQAGLRIAGGAARFKAGVKTGRRAVSSRGRQETRGIAICPTVERFSSTGGIPAPEGANRARSATKDALPGMHEMRRRVHQNIESFRSTEL